jgi:hypothetical protein
MANPTAATTAAATNEVINFFPLLKIRAFESGHVNLIVSPSKMAPTLMRLRCDPSRKQASLMPTRSLQGSLLVDELAAKRSRPPLERINCTCSYIDTC